MPLKLHLLIVTCIISVVFFAWAFTRQPEAVTVVPAPPLPPRESAYAIIINHASWGLNCRNVRVWSDSSQSDTHNTAGPTSIRADNVLIPISNNCNGQLKCEIPISAEALGGDPLPACVGKELEVEYRCFSYDRPWTARAGRGALIIDCDRGPPPGTPKPQ